MRVRPLLLLLLLLLGAASATGETTSDQSTTITLWLMPVEPAADDRDLQNHDTDPSRASLPCDFELGPAQTPAETQQQIAAFNLKFGAQSPVTVLNTTDARWSYLLLNWNEEWGTTNWAMVRGQRRTLTSLCRFAERNRVHIRLLFANWTNAFSELQDSNHPFAPDVALIGSTWTAWFARQKLLLPYSRVGEEQCHDVPGMPCAAIRYWTDVRLLFYWKRLPNASSTNEFLQLNDTSRWEPILDAFEHQVRAGGFPPFAFSVGYTPNLFYDYGQLIRSDRNDFLRPDTFGGPTVDFSSVAALETPLLLNHRAAPSNQPRLIVFPEATHQEVLNQFTHGRYSAVIEHPAFLKRWKESFDRTSAPRDGADNFFDYAGFAVLPGFAFIGGSELAVWQRTKHPDMAFNLARFLAHDEEHTKLLSSLGQLPAQHIDFGLDLLQASLAEKSSSPSPDTAHTAAEGARFVQVVKQALGQGREFPDIPEFSTAIESRDALDSIQRLWRRIGEGDQDGRGRQRVTDAARATQWTINIRINWRARVLNLVLEYWQYLLVVLVAGLLVYLYYRKRIAQVEQLRQLATIALKWRDFVLSSRALAWFSDYPRIVQRFGPEEPLRRVKLLADLRDKSYELEDNIHKDLENTSWGLVKTLRRSLKLGRGTQDDADSEVTLSVIVQESWLFTLSQYAVGEPNKTVAATFCADPALANLSMYYFPHVLIVILGEYLYNCVRACGKEQAAVEIAVRVWKTRYRHGITVESPRALTRSRVAPFLRKWKPSQADLPGDSKAFALISDMSLAAFGRRPEYRWLSATGMEIYPKDDNPATHRSVLKISLPLKEDR